MPSPARHARENTLWDIFKSNVYWYSRHAKGPDKDDQSHEKHYHADPFCNHVD